MRRPKPPACSRLALGDEMRQRVRDLRSLTDEVKAADAAIAANRQSIRTLQNRLGSAYPEAHQDAAWTAARSSLLAGQISALQRDIQYLPAELRAFVRNRLDWVERPTAPQSPVEPRPLYWTLLALVVGGMLVAAVAFILEYLRGYNKVRDERDLEAATGVPAVGIRLRETR